MWWFKDFTLDTYITVFNTKNIWTSYGNTLFYSVVGTALSMVITALGAYSLSKKRIEFRRSLMLFILVSMWFAPGMMPTYLNFSDLGLLDTRIGVLLCGAVSAFNFVLLRTFFESVPQSLEEAAKLNGASDFKTFYMVFIPLSIPALMTITLYYFVGRWNSYFWSMIMLSDETKIPLQVLLKKLVVEMSALNSEKGSVDYTVMSRETMIYAMMVIAVLPMLVIYPFVEKFFVKGIMLGSVKG
jgi:putative aldouronate transport system permease protein